MKDEQESIALKLQEVSSKILKNNSIEGLDFTYYKEKFMDYECWEALIKMTQLSIKESPTKAKDKFSLLLHIFRYRHVDDQLLIETSCALITQMNLSFHNFNLEYLSLIKKEDDYSFEELVLSNVWQSFVSHSDKNKCLERLCLLYDKVLHQESKLQKYYEIILQNDPLNFIALRYKIASLKSEKRWQETVDLLSEVIKQSKKEESCTWAFEKAGIYLLELDEPQLALDILIPYKSNRDLDPHEMIYEAYYRLENWQECLNILNIYLEKSDNISQQAILLYKKAWIDYNQNNLKEAQSNLDKSFSLDKNFLDTIELQIKIAIEQKDHKLARKWLESLIAQSKDEKNRRYLSDLQKKFDLIIDGE